VTHCLTHTTDIFQRIESVASVLFIKFRCSRFRL